MVCLVVNAIFGAPKNHRFFSSGGVYGEKPDINWNAVALSLCNLIHSASLPVSRLKKRWLIALVETWRC
jgi:hypothetical protein